MADKIILQKKNAGNGLSTDQKTLEKLCEEALEYSAEIMKKCPKNYEAALGTLFYNIGLSIYGQSQGLPNAYNLVASTEESLRNHLANLTEDFTGKITFH